MDIMLDAESAYVTLGAAARMATSLGMHRKLKDVNLRSSETEDRRKVFLILYIFDKTLSLRLGRPPAIDDDDLDPPDTQEMPIHLNDRISPIVFASHVRLSRIASEIYSRLYSARSRKQSALERFKTIAQLDKELQDWHNSLPIEIQPEKPLLCSSEYIHPVVMLHFEYFNCLTTLHRTRAFQDISIAYDELRNAGPALAGEEIGCRIYSGHLICLDAARRIAHLLPILSRNGYKSRNNMVG